MDRQNKLPIEMSERENAILNGRSLSSPDERPFFMERLLGPYWPIWFAIAIALAWWLRSVMPVA